MRILHVINDLRLAGAERLVADLAPHQKEAGLEVAVATLARYGSSLETKIADAGVPLLFPEHPQAIRSPAHILRLRKLFAGMDIVHAQLFPTQLWCVLAAATMGRNAPILVTTEHNTYNSRRGIPLFHPIDRRMYARYARIAAISDATRDDLVAYLPETAGKITVALNGIDPRRFTESGSVAERAALFPYVPPATPICISVGRLEPQKDFPNLLKAFINMPNVHLVIVGVGPLLRELEMLTQSLNVRDRVHFLGRRDDIPALLRNADVYIQSSAWEGFGIAAVEAMASGLPLVITDVPGLREVVADAGIHVPPANAPQLAEAINRVLSNEDLQTQLSKCGQERAKLFTISASVDAYTAIYNSIRKQR